jgi:hypothetical protein
MQASDSFKALIHFEPNLSDGADSMARRRDLIIIAILVSRPTRSSIILGRYMPSRLIMHIIEVYLFNKIK